MRYFVLAFFFASSAWAGEPEVSPARQEARQQVLEEAIRSYEPAPQRIMEHRPVARSAPDDSPVAMLAEPEPIRVASPDAGFQVQVFVQLAEINKDLLHLAEAVQSREASWTAERLSLNERIKDLESERDRLWGLIKYGGGGLGALSTLLGIIAVIVKLTLKLGVRRAQGEE